MAVNEGMWVLSFRWEQKEDVLEWGGRLPGDVSREPQLRVLEVKWNSSKSQNVSQWRSNTSPWQGASHLCKPFFGRQGHWRMLTVLSRSTATNFFPSHLFCPPSLRERWMRLPLLSVDSHLWQNHSLQRCPLRGQGKAAKSFYITLKRIIHNEKHQVHSTVGEVVSWEKWCVTWCCLLICCFSHES